MRIIFIRHGQTLANTLHQQDTGFPGCPLNETGLAQAEALVTALKDEPIELVMSSDIPRARQTAEPLVRSKRIPLITHPGLREIYAGDWDMDTDWKPFVSVVSQWSTDLTATLPHGDSGESFFKRYDAAVADLMDQDVDCAAVVSHGGAMKVWLSAAGHLDTSDPAQWIIHNTDRVIIEGEPGDWTIRSWGDMVLE